MDWPTAIVIVIVIGGLLAAVERGIKAWSDVKIAQADRDVRLREAEFLLAEEEPHGDVPDTRPLKGSRLN
jgi:hypothetical protein